MFTTLVEKTMDWRCPFSIAAAYTVYTRHQNSRLKGAQPIIRPTKSVLTVFMVAHNMLMSVFSFVVFRNCSGILFEHYKTHGFVDLCTDTTGVLCARLLPWGWIFYVSKYVEILDTVIIHLNRRETTFLQMYHHAGAIIACWLLSASNTHLQWIFVVFNSFVHTIMYLHYALTALRVKTPVKKAITYMQITQFVVGAFILMFHVAVFDVLSDDPVLKRVQIFAMVFNLVYVAVLFVLFKAFAERTYSEKKKIE